MISPWLGGEPGRENRGGARCDSLIWDGVWGEEMFHPRGEQCAAIQRAGRERVFLAGPFCEPQIHPSGRALRSETDGATVECRFCDAVVPVTVPPDGGCIIEQGQMGMGLSYILVPPRSPLPLSR